MEGVGANDAVGSHAHVALEIADGAVAPLAKDPVGPARVEPERVQLPLEVADVVAAEHGVAEVHNAVPQAVAGLHQLGPGLGADLPVHEQPAALLEGPDGGLGRRAEQPLQLVPLDPRAQGD